MTALTIITTTVITMSVEEWIAVPDNPRQRDTERHALRAKHLKSLSPTHQQVSMAKLPDGSRYKLDGHSRAFLWNTGSLTSPKNLNVTVYACRDLEEVKRLYDQFDSLLALETNTDKVFGAYRENELKFNSKLMKGRLITNGVRVASAFLEHGNVSNVDRAVSIHEVIKFWKEELLLLDTINPSKQDFPSGLLAAALVTLRRDGKQALEFWNEYNDKQGISCDGQTSPALALVMAVKDHRGKSGGGTITLSNHFRIAMTAYFRKDDMFATNHRGIVRPMSINTILDWFGRRNIVRKKPSLRVVRTGGGSGGSNNSNKKRKRVRVASSAQFPNF